MVIQVDSQVNLQMEKQRDRQMEALVFIPGPPSSTAIRPWSRCVAVMGLVIMVLFVGLLCFCIGFYIQRVTQGTGQSHCTEKFKQNFKLQEGRKSEEKPDEVQYDIFTAPKDAIYFIHGQVNRADGKGKVYLFWKHISRHNFNTINGTCPEVTFATEVKLIKGDQVYLVFNEGKPNLKRSTFTVYELVEQ